MTYFGASNEFADGIESKLATENYFQSFHRNVPRGTLLSFAKCTRFRVSGLETGPVFPLWGVGRESNRTVFDVEHYASLQIYKSEQTFHVEH